MDSNNDQLLSAALAFPEHDHIELVDALITSLGTGDPPPFDRAWDEAIPRRSKELSDEVVSPIPCSEVKRQAALGTVFRAEADADQRS